MNVARAGNLEKGNEGLCVFAAIEESHYSVVYLAVERKQSCLGLLCVRAANVFQQVGQHCVPSNLGSCQHGFARKRCVSRRHRSRTCFGVVVANPTHYVHLGGFGEFAEFVCHLCKDRFAAVFKAAGKRSVAIFNVIVF